jgi:hypothetical protein
VTLEESLEMQYGRSFRAGFEGYTHDRVMLHGSFAYQLRRNLWMVDTDYSYWFHQSRSIRHASAVTARYYNTGLSFLTVAARGSYRIDVHEDNEEPLYLGGNSGIRGYDKYFRSGVKTAVANLEFRFFPKIEVLSVMFGAALFADVGRAWKGPNGLGGNNTYAGFGAGLRISPERASKLDIIRIDVVKAQSGRWELSFGTGQYF